MTPLKDTRPPREVVPFRMQNDPPRDEAFGYIGSVQRSGTAREVHRTWVTPETDWTFPGFSPYIAQACEALSLDQGDTNVARYCAAVRDSFHGRSAQNQLGALPLMVAKYRAGQNSQASHDDAIDNLRLLFLSAVALQESLANAILDTFSQLELPFPEWITPEIKPVPPHRKK